MADHREKPTLAPASDSYRESADAESAVWDSMQRPFSCLFVYVRGITVYISLLFSRPEQTIIWVLTTQLDIATWQLFKLYMRHESTCQKV